MNDDSKFESTESADSITPDSGVSTSRRRRPPRQAKTAKASAATFDDQAVTVSEEGAVILSEESSATFGEHAGPRFSEEAMSRSVREAAEDAVRTVFAAALGVLPAPPRADGSRVVAERMLATSLDTSFPYRDRQGFDAGNTAMDQLQNALAGTGQPQPQGQLPHFAPNPVIVEFTRLTESAEAVPPLQLISAPGIDVTSITHVVFYEAEHFGDQERILGNSNEFTFQKEVKLSALPASIPLPDWNWLYLQATLGKAFIFGIRTKDLTEMFDPIPFSFDVRVTYF